MSLKRVRPGSTTKRLSAETWNRGVSSTEYTEGLRVKRGREDGPGMLPIFVRLKNTSGANLGRFSVVGLGDFIIDPTVTVDNLAIWKDTMAGVKSVSPNADTHRSLFAITQESLIEDEVGKALICGETVCRVNIVSTSHKFARPTTGDYTKLTSDFWGGAEILKAESGTGDKWALVRLAPVADTKQSTFEVSGPMQGTLTWTASAESASSSAIASISGGVPTLNIGTGSVRVDYELTLNSFGVTGVMEQRERYGQGSFGVGGSGHLFTHWFETHGGAQSFSGSFVAGAVLGGTLALAGDPLLSGPFSGLHGLDGSYNVTGGRFTVTRV